MINNDNSYIELLVR